MGKEKQTETNKTVKNNTTKEKGKGQLLDNGKTRSSYGIFLFFYGDVYTGGGVEPMRIGSLPDFNPVFAFD